MALLIAAACWGFPVDRAAAQAKITSVTTVVEGDSGQRNMVFVVAVDNLPRFGPGATVSFGVCPGGTASPGEDYRPFPGSTQSQPLDDFTGRTTALRFTRSNPWPKQVPVPIYGDTKIEPDETVIGCIVGAVGTRIGSPNRATGTIITDDFDPPEIYIVSGAQLYEGDSGVSNLDFSVGLSHAYPIAEVTVDYATSDGTATALIDYRAVSGTLRFAPGETQAKISVPVLGDITNEADEVFTMTLSNPTNGVLGRGQTQGVILNDDVPTGGGVPPREPDIRISDAQAQEGDSGSSNLDFAVTLSAASDQAVTVNYATADGTATAGSDYEATSGELRFAPGETTATISVPVLGDAAVEADETFTVSLSNPSNGELDRAQATGIIINDDMAVASIADARAEEGHSGRTNLDFRVTLSAASNQAVTVDYATADGTATAGSDYEAASGELRFAPGETTATISVPVLGDLRAERDETFTVSLSNPTNGELGRVQATGTIINDDMAVASIADTRVLEGDSGMASLDFQVTLSVASDLAVTVDYATADGTATAGSDYEAASGELRFAPGETTATISVPVLGDSSLERDETLTVSLSNPTNAELDRAQATGAIINDDQAMASIADLRAEEGDSGAANFDFRVTLSEASYLPITVAYATADGSASAGSDYQAASGELSFAPGETEKTISVAVLGDRAPEVDETFTVTLGSPSNAELSRTAATGTIVDDDTETVRNRALEASIANFGRTVSQDAIAAIGERFREAPEGGSEVVLGGQRLPSGEEETLSADQLPGWKQSAWAVEAGWSSPVQAPNALSGNLTNDLTGNAAGSHAAVNNFAAPGFRALHELAAQDSRSQLSLSDFLQRSSFSMALAASDEGDDEAWSLSLWGRASSGRSSWEPLNGLASDGDVLTSYLGMDGQFGERLFAGVALAHSEGEMGYEIASFGGALDLTLTSVLPYVNLQLNEQLEVWGIIGAGWGEGKYRDAVRDGRREVQSAQGTLEVGLNMAAVGLNQALTTWGNMEVGLKADAFAMAMEGEPEGAGSQREIKAQSQGIRLMLAGRTELMASAEGRLGANLEVGGRWDGGDAQTGWGTEVGGGLDWRDAALGLGVAVQGRYLLHHTESSFDDKGVSLTLEFDPGIQGRGFSLALRPAWGAHSSGTGALWNDEALRRLGGAAQQPGLARASERLDLEWGYGFGWRGDAGSLRLQGGLSQEGMGQRGYRLGGFLEVLGRTRVSMELNRQEGLYLNSNALLIRWAHKW